MLGRMAYLCLAGVVLALWALMTQVVGPELAAAAGGRPNFDARFGGYDLTDAQAYVDRLTPTGRDLYLEALHRLDGLFIPALAVFLIWSFAVLLPRWPALGMALVVVAGAAADLAENIRVATLLTAGELTPEIVIAASDATRIKAALDGFALLVFAVAVLVAGYRRFRQGRVQP